MLHDRHPKARDIPYLNPIYWASIMITLDKNSHMP